jgi:hypothetical protein
VEENPSRLGIVGFAFLVLNASFFCALKPRN